MAIKYNTDPTNALVCKDEHLTEQEHINSCDATQIIKAAMRGQLTNSGNPIYEGHDDLTQTGLSHRIMKQQIEMELGAIPENLEFDQKDLDLISPEIQKQFGFKLKKPKTDPVPDPKLNDKTTKTDPVPDPKQS